MASSRRSRSRLFAPEVVQTSAMDCGPATLKCLLEGFGISASYGRLREACQTDVDGTSIDTMEDAAGQLGLDAEQVMVPLDHVLLSTAGLLPAIAIVRLQSRVTHFVVAWRRHGPFVQVMDPATGRRWPTCEGFLRELYPHTMAVDEADWRAWAGSDDFHTVLGSRLDSLGIRDGAGKTMLARAVGDPGWRAIGALDAGVRMMASLVRSRSVDRGSEAQKVLARLLEETERSASDLGPIPETYWSVRPGPARDDRKPELLFRGAVLVRVRGLRGQPSGQTNGPKRSAPGVLSPELAAALAEEPSRPGQDLWRLLRADGLLTPIALMSALALAAAAVLVEAVLFRALLDVGAELNVSGQRLVAMVALLALVGLLLALEIPVVSGLLRMGRKLEARLRVAFLRKIPKLPDRYLHSRLASDMAERSHQAHEIRQLPALGGQFVRRVFELLLTTAGIIWLDPPSALLACVAALTALTVPLAAMPVLVERDLRVRNHEGGLSRFYLDALLGLIPIRTHGAETAVRREHESRLAEWAHAGLALQRAVVSVEGVQYVAGFGFAVWLLGSHLARSGETASVLLLVYWALQIPFLGQEIASIARQYPAHRSRTLRLLEPIGAPETDSQGDRGEVAIDGTAPRREPATHSDATSAGVSLQMEGVTVRAAGRSILEDITVSISPGTHVAVVGPSGAGKSSLVGLLLGWHRAASGRVRVDGENLDGLRLQRLRGETAWVDPAVQIWNRSLLENLQYGAVSQSAPPLGGIIEQADLGRVLDMLPDGLQTILGEGGALVSGGEGQRVRLARAMNRPSARLVILDEPFRGLDREQRSVLLSRARSLWRHATLLFITHDVDHASSFDQVIVLEGGRIVEEGEPRRLRELQSSRYARLLASELSAREGLWSGGGWRRIVLKSGRLAENDNRDGST